MYNMEFARNLAASWPWALDLLHANPLAPILNGYRDALLPSAPFDFPSAAWVGFALAPLTLLVGALVFRRLQKNFADLL